MKRTLMAAAALAAALGFANPADASIYVKPSGNDTTCQEGTNATACATVTRAAQLVTDGQSVYVLAGHYGPQTVTRKFTRQTVIRGTTATPAVLEALTVRGAGNVLFLNGIHTTGTVTVDQGSAGVVFSGTDHTNPTAKCFGARAYDGLSLAAVHVHDCLDGLTSPGAVNPDARGLTVVDSVFERFTRDAVQIGDTAGATILRNRFTDAVDPCRAEGTCDSTAGRPFHNDLFQTTGNVTDLDYESNTLANSGSQGILDQAAVGAQARHTFRGNTVTGIRGVAADVDAEAGYVIDQNTFCGALGSLWLRSREARDGPSDVRVTGNVLSAPYRIVSQPVNVVEDSGNTTPCPA